MRKITKEEEKIESGSLQWKGEFALLSARHQFLVYQEVHQKLMEEFEIPPSGERSGVLANRREVLLTPAPLLGGGHEMLYLMTQAIEVWARGGASSSSFEKSYRWRAVTFRCAILEMIKLAKSGEFDRSFPHEERAKMVNLTPSMSNDPYMRERSFPQEEVRFSLDPRTRTTMDSGTVVTTAGKFFDLSPQEAAKKIEMLSRTAVGVHIRCISNDGAFYVPIKKREEEVLLGLIPPALRKKITSNPDRQGSGFAIGWWIF